MYELGDMLLYAISASRSITSGGYKKTFDSLYRRRLLVEDREDETYLPFQRNQAIRALASLAHIDVIWLPGDYELIVAPPILVSLPTIGLPRHAILCGARSPGMVPSIRKACSLANCIVTIQSQSKFSPYGPTKVEMTGENDNCLDTVAQSIHIPYIKIAPAWSIAKLIGSLDDYIDRLHWTTEPEINWYREDFNPNKLRFDIPSKSSIAASVRLSRYKDPVRLIWIFRLHRNSQTAQVDPSWGRFAVLSALQKRLLRYDKGTRTVLVPRGIPLPILMSRSFSLCSGSAPSLIKKVESGEIVSEFEVYQNVPASIFNSINNKIGQGKRAMEVTE